METRPNDDVFLTWRPTHSYQGLLDLVSLRYFRRSKVEYVLEKMGQHLGGLKHQTSPETSLLLCIFELHVQHFRSMSKLYWALHGVIPFRTILPSNMNWNRFYARVSFVQAKTLGRFLLWGQIAKTANDGLMFYILDDVSMLCPSEGFRRSKLTRGQVSCTPKRSLLSLESWFWLRTTNSYTLS